MTRRLVVAALCLLAASCSADRDAAVAPSSTAAVSDSGPIVAAVPVDSIAMVGDSITFGSMQALEQGFATLDLDDVEIDAEGGRRMVVDGLPTSGVDAVADIADEDPPDLWVIALGTNDVANYEPEEYRQAIEVLLAAVPPDVPVVWVDTYLDEYRDRSALFNVELREALAERGQSTVVDWAAIASQEGVLSDGVHPSGYGIEQFTDRVVAAVDEWVA
jgi:lysophospholipase L1-like esterase